MEAGLLDPRSAAASGSGRASLLPCRWLLDLAQGLPKARTAGHFLRSSGHIGPAVLRELDRRSAAKQKPLQGTGVPLLAQPPTLPGGRAPPHILSGGDRAPSSHTHTRPQPLTVSCHAPSHQRQPESKWASPPAHGPWPLGHGPGQGHGACPETGSPRHPSIRGQVPFFPTPTLPTDGLPTGAPRSANKGQRPVVAPAWEAPSPHGKWTAHVLQPPAPLYPPGTWPLR